MLRESNGRGVPGKAVGDASLVFTPCIMSPFCIYVPVITLRS